MACQAMTKKFVFQDASNETSCIASKRRPFEDTDNHRYEQGAAGSSLWKGEGYGRSTNTGLRGMTHPAVGGRIMKDVLRSHGKKEEKWKAMKRCPV